MYKIGSIEYSDKYEATEIYNLVAENIVHRAIEYTPKVTGTLASSFSVNRFGDEPNDIVIINTCPYSVFVHELIFNKHPNGQAKFLEDASWEVANSYGIKPSIDIELGADRNGNIIGTVACYLDKNTKGYDVEHRRRNADELFARYYKWRVDILKARRQRYFDKLKDIENSVKSGTLGADEAWQRFNRHKLNYERAQRRLDYERSVYPKFQQGFKDDWSKGAGGATNDVKDNEKFVIGLSKYFGDNPYRDSVIKFGSEISKIDNIENTDIEKLIEQIDKDTNNEIKYLDNIKNDIRSGDENMIEQVENKLALDNKNDFENINFHPSKQTIDILNYKTNRFKDGYLHINKGSVTKIKLDDWEDIE